MPKKHLKENLFNGFFILIFPWKCSIVQSRPPRTKTAVCGPSIRPCGQRTEIRTQIIHLMDDFGRRTIRNINVDEGERVNRWTKVRPWRPGYEHRWSLQIVLWSPNCSSNKWHSLSSEGCLVSKFHWLSTSSKKFLRPSQSHFRVWRHKLWFITYDSSLSRRKGTSMDATDPSVFNRPPSTTKLSIYLNKYSIDRISMRQNC